MKRKLSGAVCLFFFATGSVFAGDVAMFENLGFSNDSKIFAFAQHGVQESTLYPYADLFVVDVAQNRFVPDGVYRDIYEQRITPGFDGTTALYQTLRRRNPVLERHGIKNTNTGRLVYILLDGDTSRNQLDFRDFETGFRFQVDLQQSVRGEGENVRARFHLNLQVIPESGSRRTVTVGLPQFDRDGISRYRIKQVIMSPDERSLIFVIEMERHAERGVDLRYMVETVRIQ